MTRKSPTSIAGIYTITCSVTGTVYVGQAVNVRRRWESHRHYLTRGTHRNCYLQRAWAKYGADAFVFAVSRDLSGIPHTKLKAALDSAEIEILRSFPETYNLMEAGYSAPIAGPETRAIWSKQRKAMWADPDFKRKHSEAIKALYANPEWKAKRDAAVREGHKTAERKAKAAAHANRLWASEAHRQEQGARRTANWQNPEYRAQQSAARKAAWADPEIRARRSAAIAAAHARRRAAKLAAD